MKKAAKLIVGMAAKQQELSAQQHGAIVAGSGRAGYNG
jgi:hypothetical protein